MTSLGFDINREKETKQLESLLKDVQDGNGRLVFIGSDAGTGKTQFVRAFLEQHRTACLILENECNAMKAKYGNMNEIRNLFEEIPLKSVSKGNSAIIKKIFNGIKKSVAPILSMIPIAGTSISGVYSIVFNVIDEFKPDKTNKGDIEELHDAIIKTLRILYKQTQHPIIIFLDDIHLASVESLNFFTRIADELLKDPFPILVVNTFRRDDAYLDKKCELPRVLGEIDATIQQKKIKDGTIMLNALNNSKEKSDEPAKKKKIKCKLITNHTARKKSDELAKKKKMAETDQKNEIMHSIAMELFGLEEISSFIAKRFHPNTFPDDFPKKIHQHTNGNPMFVNIMIEFLAEKGDIRKNIMGQYELIVMNLDHLPDTLSEIIAERLRFLDEIMNDILDHAAVLGDSFRLDMLSQLGLEKEEVLVKKLADMANKFQIFSMNSEYSIEKKVLSYYSFTHNLIRKYAYDKLSADQRRLYHKRAAEIILYLCDNDLEKNPELKDEHQQHLRASQNLINGWSLELTDSREAIEISLRSGSWEEMIEEDIMKVREFYKSNQYDDGYKLLSKIEESVEHVKGNLKNEKSIRLFIHLYRALYYFHSDLWYFASHEVDRATHYAGEVKDLNESTKLALLKTKLRRLLIPGNKDPYLLPKFTPLSEDPLAFYRGLGSFFRENASYDIVVFCFLQELESAKKQLQSQEYSAIYYRLSLAYDKLGDIDNNINCLKQAIDAFQLPANGNREWLIRYFKILGGKLFETKKDYEQAFIIYSEGLRIAADFVDSGIPLFIVIDLDDIRYYMAYANAALGYIFFQKEKFLESREHYRTAHSIFEALLNEEEAKKIQVWLDKLKIRLK